MRAAAQEILPPGYAVKFIGQAEEFGKTVKYMVFAFSLALVLLYMVLASQFNSFLQPAIIMLAQPLAIIGGVAALWLFGQSLNIYSMIGLVLLIGLVAKNSILLVDLTNQRREEGLNVDEALRNACPIRMRPVLMTSATIILALFPAALGLGAAIAPMGMLTLAMFDTITALNPIGLVWSILRIPGPYFVAALAFEAVIAVNILKPFVVAVLIPIPFVPALISGFLNLYLIMVGSRILGLLFYTQEDKLGWFSRLTPRKA